MSTSDRKPKPLNPIEKANGHADPNLAGLPPWMAKMRRAAMDAISEEDIKAIVQNQVKRAKDGDAHAIRFVFDQVLGGGQMKGATFIQNNYPADDNPQKAVDLTKVSHEQRLEMVRRRVNSGRGSDIKAAEPDLS
jgi:hypothetical protein